MRTGKVRMAAHEALTAADIQKVIDDAKKDGRKKALFQIEDQNGNRFVALGLG